MILRELFVRVKLDDSGVAGGLNRIEKRGNATRNALGRLVGVIASFATVSSITRASEEMAGYDGQLKNVTSSAEELKLVQEGIFQITQNVAGATIQSSVELYKRFAQSREQIGATNDELLKGTEVIQKLGAVSGKSTDEINSAIIQLGQGLSSGVLQGDELRSIRESVPELAQAIADGMGVAVGSLKELGAEGVLTSKTVFDAILKNQKKVEAQFDKLPKRAGKSWGRLQQTLTAIFGVAGSPLNKAIAGFIDRFNDMLIVFKDSDGVKKLSNAFNGIIKAVKAAFGAMQLLYKMVAGAFSGSFNIAGGALAGFLTYLVGIKKVLKFTGLGLLIILLDDINTYLEGGKSFIGEYIEKWKKFRETNPILSKVVEWLGIITGAIGGIGLLAGQIFGVGNSFKFIGKIASSIVKFLSKTSPLGLAIAGIIGAAGLIITNWDTIKEFFSGVVTHIKSAWSGFTDALIAPFKAFSDWVKNSWLGKVLGSVSTAVDAIKSADNGSKPIRRSLRSGPAIGRDYGSTVKTSAKNTSNVTNKMQTNIVVNATSSDAKGVANEVANAVNNANKSNANSLSNNLVGAYQ